MLCIKKKTIVCCIYETNELLQFEFSSSAVKANESAHVALNVLFSSKTFLFLDLSMVGLPGVEKLNKSRASRCHTSMVVMHILSDKKLKTFYFNVKRSSLSSNLE